MTTWRNGTHRTVHAREPHWPVVARLLGCVILLETGCQSLFFLTDPDASETVKAEYSKIDNQRVAVLVWADRSILDEHTNVRLQVAKAVAYELEKRLPDARLVPAKRVHDFQTKSDADWEGMSNVEIGRELGAELLLRLDLFEYTTRATDTRELRKARIAASLLLYECGSDAGSDPLYSSEVRVTYPPESHHGVGGTRELDLLQDARQLFAEVTTRKFYDHQVKLHNRPDW